jgi:TetR/AcrR family transcriptional repressor of mexJK operon
VKRAAIIAAARDLFVRQGVDRVSMDAVAAQAGVSKRTVYDYFGDKRRLFLAILADASESLNASAHKALDEHLPAGAEITTVSQLEKALTAVAPVEEALAERFARLADTGLLETSDPRLATAHFGALTLLLAYNAQPNPAHADPELVRQIMIDGVHTFIRAYAARQLPGSQSSSVDAARRVGP